MRGLSCHLGPQESAEKGWSGKGSSSGDLMVPRDPAPTLLQGLGNLVLLLPGWQRL